MKIFIRIFVLLITVLPLTIAPAAENITGTWKGKLVISPGAEPIQGRHG
jgi:hypothetical protein